MKKTLLLYIILFFSFTCESYSQNVAINTDGSLPHASAILDVKSTAKGILLPRMTTAQRNAIIAPAIGLQVFDSDTKSFWFYNGTGWVQFSMGSATNFWTPNGTYIFNNNPGNVGIGTSIPANKFTVQTPAGDYGLAHTNGTVTIASWIGDFGSATGGWLGTKSNHPLNFFTNGGSARMTVAPDGSIGIGTATPHNKLQIGATPDYLGFDLAIGNGTGNMNLNQSSYLSAWGSNTSMSVFPGTGYFGINTASPANRLQIGSVGAAGFNGNDLAIGNGSNAMVIYQSNSSTLLASTTDIVLMPRNNGQGRIGINTNTPRAPLDVVDQTNVTAINGYYSYLNAFSNLNGIQFVNTPSVAQSVSIIASGRVYASEFDAYSDARIKEVSGISNTRQDLEIINALQITNYTMRDVVKYGNKSFKKIIAQEVEKIYPQVVSKHTDFIPNVYQATNRIEKTKNGYLLSFAANHTISKEAKKLRVLLTDSDGMQSFSILSVPDNNKVIIGADEITRDKVFVYGEEVDDFRTVDYEGLSMLNISATQELSKLVKAQQQTMKIMAEKIEQLTAIVKGLKETRLAVLK